MIIGYVDRPNLSDRLADLVVGDRPELAAAESPPYQMAIFSMSFSAFGMAPAASGGIFMPSTRTV